MGMRQCQSRRFMTSKCFELTNISTTIVSYIPAPPPTPPPRRFRMFAAATSQPRRNLTLCALEITGWHRSLPRSRPSITLEACIRCFLVHQRDKRGDLQNRLPLRHTCSWPRGEYGHHFNYQYHVKGYGVLAAAQKVSGDTGLYSYAYGF